MGVLNEVIGAEKISSIELLKWVRENSNKMNCQSCGESFDRIVWYIDTKPGSDVTLIDKGEQDVFVVCCNCGRENPLRDLVKALQR
ncbi:MAG: hypothetical protein ABWW66_05785 [Archaeoglobaceae archaeon]